MSGPPVKVCGLPPLEWGFKVGRAYEGDDGVLVLLAYAATDWVRDPQGAPAVLTACPLGFAAPNRFSLSSRVSVASSRTTFDAPVLMVWHDDAHWAKLCFERAPTGTVGVVSVVNNGGVSDDANAFDVDADYVYLRVSRVSPNAWAFHASRDGKWWEFVRVFRLDGDDDDAWRVGFLAQSPTGPGCAARFENTVLSGHPPSNLRDGS